MAYLFDGAKSKETLVRSLGIFELRGLARELGVKSPTTKKREELVDLILDIVSSGEEPSSLGKRKGRPFKKLSSIDQIATTVTSSWVDDKVKPTYEGVMCFAQTLPNFDNILDGSKKLNGYAREVDGMISFFDYANQSRIFIRNDIQFSSKITNGDFVEVEASPLHEKGQFVANKILTINDIDAESYEPCIVNNGEVVIGEDKMTFGCHEVTLGRRNVISLKEDLFETDFLDELEKESKNKNIKLIVLALNTSYENMIMFKNVTGYKKFVSVSGSDARYNLDLLIDAINYAYNCDERGENVFVYVNDIMHTLKAVENCFERDARENVDIILQKLLGIAKAFEYGNTATCLFGYSDLDTRNDYFVDKVLKICKICE